MDAPEGTYYDEPQWIIEQLREVAGMGDSAIAHAIGSYRETIHRIRTGRQSGIRLVEQLRLVLAANKWTRQGRLSYTPVRRRHPAQEQRRPQGREQQRIAPAPADSPRPTPRPAEQTTHTGLTLADLLAGHGV